MLTEQKSRRAVERQKRLNREWFLQDHIAAMKREELGVLEKEFLSDAPAAKLSIADSLNRLASWHGVAGQLALLDGGCSGWVEIHRSWLYRALSLRMQISVFQRGRVLGQFRPVKGLETVASASALCLAYAMVVCRDHETRSFGDAVRRMLMDRDVVREDYWRDHPLGPFTIQLLAFYRHESLDVRRDIGRGFGVYQGIVDAWNEPSALAKAIAHACELHCEQIGDTSGDYVADFRSPPFDLVPAEILATYSVRQTLGLETPSVDHPLLQPPFSTPVGSPSEIEDELLNRVEARS
jgi:hypothetical protein